MLTGATATVTQPWCSPGSLVYFAVRLEPEGGTKPLRSKYLRASEVISLTALGVPSVPASLPNSSLSVNAEVCRRARRNAFRSAVAVGEQ